MNTTDFEFRNKVVQTGLLLLEKKLTVGTWGNISLRASGNRIFITPSGRPYDTLNPEDIVIIDLDGRVLDGKRIPSVEWPTHTEIYRSRPDLNCVIHTHSVYSTAVAVSGKNLPAVSEDFALLVGPSARCCLYAFPGTPELAENVTTALSGSKAVLMPCHGAIGAGVDEKEALLVCEVLEKTAKIFIMAHSLGTPLILSEEDCRRLGDMGSVYRGRSRDNV